MSIESLRNESAERAGHFATTQWSVVLACGDRERPEATAALAQLCETYWYPLYTYVRRQVGDVHEAQDLTQAFLANFLEKELVAKADPERGRFRSYLLTACKRFLINEWHKARAAKRGGGQFTLSLDWESGESRFTQLDAETLTAEQLYEQQWAMTLLQRVMEQLRAEQEAKGKLAQFDVLKQFLAGATDEAGYGEAGKSLGISEGAAKVAAHRLRGRYRELLRKEIAQTVSEPDEVDDEIRSLFAVLSGRK